MGEGYVLAMYDVRGKQEFIYRSTKCKEIIGGSHIIEDVFKDYLFPAAKEYRNEKLEKSDGNRLGRMEEAIYYYKRKDGQMGESPLEFSCEKFEERMRDGTCIGEVVYEGGGNFLVLYKDEQTCIEINKRFSRGLLRKVDTLKVLCTWIEIQNFNDYREDQKSLYARHSVREAQECMIHPVNTLPFVQVSSESGRPFTKEAIKNSKTGREKVTTEQKAKYDKYEEYQKSLSDEDYDREQFLLDKLVEERGKESLLAVIYIDGNNMGARVQKCLGDSGERTDYDYCVRQLRKFSKDIQEDYVRDRIGAINQCLEEKYNHDNKKVRRTIVAAGDEMTIICNARDALDVVRAYFGGLSGGTSCAGVAIFHSHAPYADAYRIAEECCESGKTWMKEAQADNVNLLDFHFCQGGIGISLEHIRERESGGDMYSRPWRMVVPNKHGEYELEIEISPVYEKETLKRSDCEVPYKNAVNRMTSELKKLERSNIKALRQAAETEKWDFLMECRRINAHRKPADAIDFSLGELLDEEKQRKLIYDVSLIYDLWFSERTEDEENE